MTDLWNFTDKPGEYEARQAQRTAIFNKIAPKHNWKNPIDAWIKPEEFEDANNAAIWFTGAGLVIIGNKVDTIRVTGPGYFATIGA